jgi:HEAT repeat protein
MEPRLGGKAAVPDLLNALRGTDHQARLTAGRVLKRLKDPAAVPVLLAALEDEHTQVRSIAAAALGAIGAQQGERASDAVASLGVPALIRALRDRQIPVRMASARALGQIGEPEAVTDLLESLKDVSPHVRAASAAALGFIGLRSPAEGTRANGGLLAALGDLDSAVRTEAAEALGRIAGAHPEPSQRRAPVDALLESFRDDQVQVRSAAARALGMIGPDAVAGLVRALKHEEMQVRSAAAWVLEQIGEQYGKAAGRAVEPLIQALDDEDEQVRWYAVGALGVLRDPRAVPRLVKMLHDTGQPYAGPYEEMRICDLAAESLERIATPEARAAVRIWRVGQGKSIK